MNKSNKKQPVLVRNFGVESYSRFISGKANRLVNLLCGQAAWFDEATAKIIVGDFPEWLELVEPETQHHQFYAACGLYAAFPLINGEETFLVSDEVKAQNIETMLKEAVTATTTDDSEDQDDQA